MPEREVVVGTPNGPMPVFVALPEGDGPWPMVLIFMDVSGWRPDLFDKARAIAASGHVAVLPDLYHRLGQIRLALRTRDRISTAVIRACVDHVMDRDRCLMDAGALIGWAEDAAEVSNGAFGTLGYCMGGPWSVWTAAEWPDRCAAAAILHGTPLVSDRAQSPHLCLGPVRAELYCGYGGSDGAVSPAVRTAFTEAIEAAGIVHVSEVHPGAGHGFTFPSRPEYSASGAAKVAARLDDLFARRLA